MDKIMTEKRYKIDEDAIMTNWPVDGTVFTHLKTGQRVFLDNRDLSIFCHVLETRCWEPQTWEVIDKVLYKDAVFVDIGANIGIHSIYASRHTHNIYAFEPTPRTFKILQQNLFMNGVFNANIFNVALSNTKETVKFTNMVAAGAGFNGMTNTNKSIRKVDNTVCGLIMSEKEEISVNTDLLTNLIDKNVAVDLLKIDVEGAEVGILESATDLIQRSFKINLLIEAPHPDSESFSRLLTLINEFNFDISVVRYLTPIQKVSVDNIKQVLLSSPGDLWLKRK